MATKKKAIRKRKPAKVPAVKRKTAAKQSRKATRKNPARRRRNASKRPKSQRAAAVRHMVKNGTPKKVARDVVKRAKRGKVARIARAAKRKNPARRARRRRNSELQDANVKAAAKMYQKFHGKPAGTVRTVAQPRVTPSALADLGRLVELEINGRNGRVLAKFPESGAGVVHVGTTAHGGQLYFVGGDQEITGLGSAIKDHVDVGQVRRIVYFTSKAFHNFEPTEYNHRFGEDGGERPTLCYDVRSKRLYLVGGSYRVKREGIVN